MKKIIASAIIAVGLIAGTVGTASAETLARPAGSAKATIKPTTAGVPGGAKVTKARVTVKKGKKTLASNKKSYNAKPGTYRATSKVTYQPAKRAYIADPIITATCTVATHDTPMVNGSEWVDSGYWVSGYTDPYGYWVSGYIDYYGNYVSGYWVSEYVSGYWVEDGYYTSGNEGLYTVNYTGTCTDWYYVGGKIKWVTWNTGWSSEEYLYEGGDNYTAGDSMYVGSSNNVTVKPYYLTYGKSRTLKSTRAVVVA